MRLEAVQIKLVTVVIRRGLRVNKLEPATSLPLSWLEY